jgi:hypothetical protein
MNRRQSAEQTGGENLAEEGLSPRNRRRLSVHSSHGDLH